MGAQEIWNSIGSALAGAVFGTAWWFWVDAVVCSAITVPFLHYLPGIAASLAAFMFDCVKGEELVEYSPFDDGEGCRPSPLLATGCLFNGGANVRKFQPPQKSLLPGCFLRVRAI